MVLNTPAKIFDGHWYPGIGDPTVMGWLTVAAYLGTSVLCWQLAHKTRGGHTPRQKEPTAGWMVWYVLAFLTLALGVNKQLDLQTWLTVFARKLAKSQGWYDRHRLIQEWFIGSIVGVALILILWLSWLSRSVWRHYRLALIGTVFLTSFVVIRAASFHHVDHMLGWRLAGWRMNWLLELGGIGCIAVAATVQLRRGTVRK